MRIEIATGGLVDKENGVRKNKTGQGDGLQRPGLETAR